MIRLLLRPLLLLCVISLLLCGAAMVYGQAAQQPMLTYVQEGDGLGADIYLYDLRSGLDLPFVVRPSSDYYPTWSPDGEKLAFVSAESGGMLYVVDTTGTNLKQLTTADSRLVSEIYGVLEPGWTSSGDKLVLVRERPPTTGARRYLYYLVNPETGRIDQITDEHDAVQDYLTDFRLVDIPSPDGEFVLQLASNNLGSGLFLVNEETSNSTLIHSLPDGDIYRNGSFSWSWDSQFVAFTVDESGRGGSQAASYALNIETSEQWRIGSGLINHSLAWRP